MADEVVELMVTASAVGKLGARSIMIAEAEQLLRNRHAIVRNRRGHPRRRQSPARRLLVGETDGGRILTLVVEATIDSTTWLLITA